MAPPHVLMRLLLLSAAASAAAAAGDGCSTGCDLALGSYLISRNQNLTYIASLFDIPNYKTLGLYNTKYPNLDYIQAGDRLNVSFTCGCNTFPNSAATYLAGSLPYKVSTGDTYTTIAGHFNNLTTSDWLARTNTYPENNIPDTGTVNVTVNCSCGDTNISPYYGLFLTYPLTGLTLAAVAANYSFNSSSQLELLRKYNPGMDTATSGLVFIPVKDPNGSYRPLKSSGTGSFCSFAS
ncbi:chitin elicitor receptor kinase 1-like isoform X3 [Miscanthus floridulus]|uniref:chitin elicitor receptor kinase 1-like isoform X3 n=1 Tax=Miscanthus floridulus TaxID=154761 RepID=UPI003458144A